MEETTTLKALRPFVGHGRATISESPVDEVVRPSGIAVPMEFEGDYGIDRGVILHIALAPGILQEEILRTGMVVFYRRGIELFGTVIVDLEHILAYETDDE